MKGFTLVEMLVALAALAVLATGGFAVAGVSSSSHQAIQARQIETQQLLRMRAALRSDLTQAAARRARNADGDKPQAAMTGASRSEGTILSLVRRGWDNPLKNGRSSLQHVDYRISGGRLERIWRHHVDGSPQQPPQLLMEGVHAAHVEFYDFDQWTDGWTGAPNRPLPRAIRLTLTIEGRGDIAQVFLLPEYGA